MNDPVQPFEIQISEGAFPPIRLVDIPPPGDEEAALDRFVDLLAHILVRHLSEQSHTDSI